MKIKYLGTSAAEGIPALFCECEVCQKARLTGGKNIRSRCQLLVNDDLLIDYPPDSFYHFTLHHVDLSKIHHLLITHIHEDHFYSPDFEYFLRGYSHPKEGIPFTIYGSIDLKNDLEKYVNHPNNQGLRYVEIVPYKTVSIGKYLVTPLCASHGTNHPYIYIISDGQKEFLFCHDSGLLKEEVFTYLKNNKHYFNLVSMDCNNGDSNEVEPIHHMNLTANIETIEKLKQIGAVDANTKVILNHFSHNGWHILHDDIKEKVSKYGFDVSYDGAEFEF